MSEVLTFKGKSMCVKLWAKTSKAVEACSKFNPPEKIRVVLPNGRCAGFRRGSIE